MRFVTVALDDFDFDGSSNVVAMPLDNWSGYNELQLSTGTGKMSGSGRRYNPVAWPDVAVTPDGDWVAVWADDRDTNGLHQIKMRGFLADGTEWLPEQTVNARARGNQTIPRVAIADDRRFVVVWESDGNNNDLYNIRMRGYNADGTQMFADREGARRGSGDETDLTMAPRPETAPPPRAPAPVLAGAVSAPARGG